MSAQPMDESMTPRGLVENEVAIPPATSSDTTTAPLFAFGFNTVTSMDNFFGSTGGVAAASGEMAVGEEFIQSAVWSRTPVEERKIEPPALSTFPTPFEGDPNAEEWDVIMNRDGGSFAIKPKYLKEMELLRMLAQLREKPEWWLKVNEPTVVNRWKKEMYKQATLLTPQTIEYGIQELKYHSQLYQQSAVRGHSILPSAIDGVVQNDQLISDELLLQLRECLKPFEEVPESERDYHPGSDHQVIDLVHPSLYCLRIGQTKLTKEPIPLKDTLRSIGSGEIVSPLPNHGGFRYATSKNFAWLPAEFEVSPNGSKVNIASYINNIHPIQHAKLYGVLEEVFASFIPMFERVLSHLKCGIKTRITRMNDQKYNWFEGPKLDTTIFEDHLTQERAALKIASSSEGQDEPFYLDVVKKKPERGLSYDQFRATVQLGLRIRHEQKLSRPAQVTLLQFQDRLACLYLESTFDAYTKIEGLLTHPLPSNPSTSNSSQPPFVGFPDDLHSQLPRLLKSTQFAMAVNAARSLIPQAEAWRSRTNLGVFTEKMTQRWFVLFKRRLASLYPAMDQATQHQYLSILLKKEYANLVRLGAAIQSVSGEIIELAGIIAARGTNSKLIELNHIQSGLNQDHELQALDRYLTQRYLSPHHTTSTVSSSSSGSCGAAVAAAAARLNDVSADELTEQMRDFMEERAATSPTVASDMVDEEMKVSVPVPVQMPQVNQISTPAAAASSEEKLCQAMTTAEEKKVWLAGELKRKQLDPEYDQYEANHHLLLGMKVDGRHPWHLTFSPTAQLGLVQLQDGLARLYLESTFDACMTKASVSAAVVEPVLIDFHLSDDLLKQMYQIIPISHQEMTKAIEQAQVNGGGTGTIFTEAIAQKWVDLFKQRLPDLYPDLDSVTRQQYLDVVLKPENHPISRLCAGIQFLISELIELSGNCARDFLSNVICLNHLIISIYNDAEISVLTAQLQQRYPPTLLTDPRLQPEPIVPIMIPKANEGAAAAETTMVDVTDEGASLPPSMEQKEPDGAGERAAAVSVDESLLEYAVNLDNSYGNHEDLRWKDIYQPEVAWPFSPDTTAIKNTYSLAGRTLQVIVKLQNIELTPEKPNYPGGAWHVEGMRNESIVASGIYYINSTNITESRLSFRAGVSYFDPQDNSKGPLQVYGLTRQRGLNQELGSLITKSGRAIAFPNIYQNQVQPFQLADPTLPGKRQILVFFLVDPTIRITSTANIPPQQRHWLKTATGENTPTILAEMNAGTPLIPDLVNLASEYYADSGVIDHVEACRLRDESMKERKTFNEQNTRTVFQRPFWVECP